MAQKRKRSTKSSKKSVVAGGSTAANGLDKFEKIIIDLVSQLNAEPDNIQIRLELAEMYNATGLEKELPKLLLDIKSKYPFKDEITNGRFDRLLAIGYSHQHKLLEAEKILANATKDYPEAIDLWYTLCYVKLNFKDYKPAIEAGKRYLELWQDASKAPSLIGMTCHTSNHKSQLLNFIGCAYRGEKQLKEAKKYFTQATKANSKNHFSYINHANLLISLDEKDEARQVINAGLDHCGQIQELKMIAQIIDRDFTISACLMVKNEEEMLPRCLESIRSWVDEIVVVDTGSTDKTIEIAKAYGAKIFHQEWVGDFSKHRNYTIENATSDWIFIIDADEEMVADDVPLLLRVISEPTVDIISINVNNVYEICKDRPVLLPSVRFFKRELGIYYEGVVHNQIRTPDEVPTARINVCLKHYGYDLSPEKMKKKLERSRALLLKQLEETPDYAFAHYNMAQLARSGSDETIKERSQVVITHATKAVELTDPDIIDERHIHIMALDQLAWSHFYLKEYDLANKYCRQVLDLKPNYLDPLLLCGHISLKLMELDKAEIQFQKYLSVQAKFDMAAEKDNLIIIYVDGRIVAWYALACTSMLRGDSPTAIERLKKVLDLDETYLETNAMLGEIYLKENELQLAETFFLKQINDCDDSSDAHKGLGDIYYRQGEQEQAEKSYLQAIAISKDPKQGIERLIRLYSDTNQIQKLTNMIKCGSEAWFSDPTHVIAMAERLIGLDRRDQAIIMYQHLIDIGQNSGAVLNDLGNCYYHQKKYEKAATLYSQATLSDDSPVISWRNLAVVLVSLKQYQKALVSLEKYIIEQPEVIDAYQLAGDISVQLQEFSKALSYYEKYLAKASATPVILHRLSECYLFMGHKDAAILGFQRAITLDPGYEPSLERLKELEQVVENAS